MEQAVGAAVGFALTNLVQSIDHYKNLISNNYEKISDLQEDLGLLKTFMANYTKKHYKSPALMELAKEIRGVAFEVEDVFETYVWEEAQHQSKNKLARIFRAGARLDNLKDLGEKVQELRGKVQEVRDYNLLDGSILLAVEELTRTDSDKIQAAGNLEPDRIIGFEDAVNEVLGLLGGEKLVRSTKNKGDGSTSESKSEAEQHAQQLSDQSMDLEVASIHGMFGLGKTTLAKKVLIDVRIEYQFFTRIFVVVSNEYKKDEVLLSILSNFHKNIREQKKSTDELVEMVKQALKYKYLIVMDDVWDATVWDEIRSFLPNNKKGSRVLVTTRIKDVASYAATRTDPYLLRFMRDNEAKELLRIKVFIENKCPPELEAYEGKILAKCNGLPLAIVVTAGIIRNDKRNPNWWKEVLAGTAQIAKDTQHKVINDLIRRSYDNLLDYLKPCFLYLGVFPEDVGIPVSKLLQLWMAEGLIPQVEGMTVEEKAVSCLSELVGRNLVMVEKKSLSGKIKTCIIHDTVRDFCKNMAKTENLFQQVQPGTVSSSPRRLFCIPSKFQGYICNGEDAENVRSFLSFGEETTLSKESCPNVGKKFKLLRVFDILSIKCIGRFPTPILSLFLLRFIAICWDLQILPRKMSHLVNLQTLIVHTPNPTLKIEADIWGMTNLRHLQTNTSALLPVCSKQSASSYKLQSLSTVSPDSLVDDLVFERCKELKKLGVCGNLAKLVKANGDSRLFDKLCELSRLENLKLHNNDPATKLPALPPENKFPARLKRLSLQDTGLDWQIDMPTLEKLKFLEILKLKDNAFKGEDWKTEGRGFRSLKVLYIGATDLMSWESEVDHFPELRCLVLKQCKKLLKIPSDFAYLKKLEMIELEYTRRSVVDSARRILILQLREIIGDNTENKEKSTPIKLTVYPPED